jgi:hypothetical protein
VKIIAAGTFLFKKMYVSKKLAFLYRADFRKQDEILRVELEKFDPAR